MTDFEVDLVGEMDNGGTLTARQNPPLRVAAPPAFGGPEGVWSPEELLVASVGGCLMSTFLYFANRFNVAVKAYGSTARGSLSKTPDGLRFTDLEVAIRVTVPDDSTRETAASLRFKEKLEQYCPVSASLNCPVRLDLSIKTETGGPNLRRGGRDG